MTLPLPRFPTPSGPSPQKERFFNEIAFALELLALYNALSVEGQETFINTLRGLSVEESQRRLKR